MKFTGYVRDNYDGKNVTQYPEGACSPVPDTISNVIPDGPVHGPNPERMEDRIEAILQNFPDWKKTWAQYNKTQYAVEIEQGVFSIVFRSGSKGFSYGLYQDGVLNVNGVPEKVRVKYKVGPSTDTAEDFECCINECLLHTLHAL